MPHDPDLARVWRKAAEQGYSVREMREGLFTLRYLRPPKLARVMGPAGKLRAWGTLDEIEAWLDRDRRPM